MTAKTPETGGFDGYYDANGVERVRIGDLGNGDYGLIVRDPTGLFEIIDGVSDVFTIIATGTLTTAGGGATPGHATVSVDLTTGLNYAPLVLGAVQVSSQAFPTTYIEITLSGAGAGLPVIGSYTLFSVDLGSGVTRITADTTQSSAYGSLVATTYRYYVLKQLTS